MEERIQLKLVGITYNQIESGVYALILEDMEARRRLAIVIGYPEAQSIECHLQKVRTPRPLSHDLMANIMKALDARLLYIDIHRLPTGPYAGRIVLQDRYGEVREIDARSSDAIAVAIRMGAPIYTSKKLLDEKGYEVKKDARRKSAGKPSTTEPEGNTYRAFSDQMLNEMLEKHVLEENYEKAAEIKQEIERRKRKD